MLLVSLLFGSVIGAFAGVISFFALGASFGSAVSLYLCCACLPVLMSLAAATAQLATSGREEAQAATR